MKGRRSSARVGGSLRTALALAAAVVSGVLVGLPGGGPAVASAASASAAGASVVTPVGVLELPSPGEARLAARVSLASGAPMSAMVLLAGGAALPEPPAAPPTLTRLDQAPPGDAWRSFAPAASPFVDRDFTAADEANMQFLYKFMYEIEMSKAPFTRTVVATALAGLSPEQHHFTRRAALSVLADGWKLDDLDPEIRSLIREIFLDYLHAPDLLLVDSALYAVAMSGAYHDPVLLARLREIGAKPVSEAEVCIPGVGCPPAGTLSSVVSEAQRYARWGSGEALEGSRYAPRLRLREDAAVGDGWRYFTPASVVTIEREHMDQDHANGMYLLRAVGVRNFTHRHAALLLEGLSADQHWMVRHSALSAIAFAHARQDVDPEIRAVLRDALKDYIGSPEPKLVECAIRMVSLGDLVRDEQVMDRVFEVALRPGPHCADWQSAVDAAMFGVMLSERPPKNRPGDAGGDGVH